MAPVKALNGKLLLVQISDGDDPPVFAHDCLINTDRGIAFASETNREVIPDCDNVTDPDWSEIHKDSLSATITGAGMLHTSSVDTWFDWYTSNDAKDVRVLLSGVSLANGGGHWAGQFKLTSWEINGSRNEKSTSSVTLESHGALTWVPASA